MDVAFGELVVFGICALIVLGGALGVIISRNPVHAALSLVATLFGIAVLFIAQNANFLAAVQVIVYTGAIVVLILFVLMLLGVDRAEDLSVEPIAGGRAFAFVMAFALVVMVGSVLLVPVWRSDEPNASIDSVVVTGERSATAPLEPADESLAVGDEAVPAVPDDATDPSGIEKIGRSLFTDYVFAFEVTAALLTIAVVGAVVLARRPASYEPLPEPQEQATGEPPDEDSDESVEEDAQGGTDPAEVSD